MSENFALFYHFLIGFFMAFIGLMSPGLLTMSALNIAIDRGSKEAGKFAIGASLPIIIQAHIALLGAHHIKMHPEILDKFSVVAIFIFFILSIVFFKQYRQRKLTTKTPRFSIRSSFWYGFFISAINPLAIPFYFTYSTLLELQGWLQIKEPYITIFVLGAVLGVVSILTLYGKHAPTLLSRLQFVTKHFKLILSIIMLGLAVISLLHVLKVY